MFSCFESAMDVFEVEFNEIYKGFYPAHQLIQYNSRLRYFKLPYTGYNINDEKGNHVVLFSYLESNGIIYIEINDEKVSFHNTRKY